LNDEIQKKNLRLAWIVKLTKAALSLEEWRGGFDKIAPQLKLDEGHE